MQHRISALGALLLLWALLSGWSAAAGAQTLTILLSDESPPYLEAANVIRTALEPEFREQLFIRTLAVQAASADAVRQSTLVVTVGSLAAQKAASWDPDGPILATLIPRQAFEDIVQNTKPGRHQFSAIYLDQPLSRQLALIRGVLPEARSVGVMAGPATARELRRLKSAADRAGLRLAQEVVASDSDLFPALQRLLPETDVLLALPDPIVINRGSIQSLLLTTYRHRVPVAGYSASQVDAGVLAAVYSTPAQIAQQAAQIVRDLLRNGSGALKGPVYPKYFSLKVNRNVAHSLGLDVPGDPALLKRLESISEDES
jgi:ABC-type uncharacterized transport system substrate-binding protein